MEDRFAQLRHAQSLISQGRRAEALEVASRLAEYASDRADWNDAVGALFTYCERPARALPFFQGAVSFAPRHAGYLYNLATALRMTGDLAGAESTLDEVIAIAPGDVRAHYTRSDLRVQTPDNNHVDAMIQLLHRGSLPPAQHIMLRFAIAKELEDLARYAESFSCLAQACASQRRSFNYNVADDVATIQRIVESHGQDTLRDGAAGVDGEQCIFVVGLPRTGTTLVERILASHSAVTSVGENPAFPLEAVRAVQRIAERSVSKFEFVDLSLRAEPRALAAAYLASLPGGGETPRVVDKQPLNYLYLGLIHRVLPRSRVIVVVREPTDACYSMYKTLFTGAYPFSYDLRELARYYGAWHTLIKHWRTVLGASLLVVQYEDLVANQEGVSKRILDHCGLPWESACLDFHENPSTVTTASAAQVRRKLYPSSVGKWRHYERQLSPLTAALRSCEPPGGWRFM